MPSCWSSEANYTLAQEWAELHQPTNRKSPLLRRVDDTQLFFSFHPRNFESSLAHLQTALKHISSWMSANLLTVDSSKTEFLIISLKR